MRASKQPSRAPLVVPASPVPPGAFPGIWKATITLLPPSANQQRRMHWSAVAKHAQDWLWLLRQAFGVVPKATGPRRVIFIRYAHGLLDEGDNLPASYKFVRDLLQPERIDSGVYGPGTKKAGQPFTKIRHGIGVIVGDGPGQAEFVYRQERIPRAESPRTEIVIQDIVTEKI